MKKKWIGSVNPGHHPETGEWHDDLGHDVTVRGQYVGNVKPGDVIDIPDELCEPVMKTGPDGKPAVDDPAPSWPSSLWEDVPAKPTANKKKSEGEV